MSLCDKEEESREHLFKYKELENRISQAWEKMIEKIIIETKKAMLEDGEKTRNEIEKIKGIDLRKKKNKTVKEKTRKETIENKEKNRVIEDPRKRNNPARTEMDKGEGSSERIIDWIRKRIK